MRSMLGAVAATAALLVLSAAPSAGHTGLMPGEIAPGTTLDGELVLAHGCGPGGTIPTSDEDASATQAVTVVVPEGLRLTPKEVDGWDLAMEVDAAGRVTEARWQIRDADGAVGAVFLQVGLDATGIADGTQFAVPVVQDCVDGEQLRWTLPEMDERDGQFPATRLSVTSAAANAPVSSGPSAAVLALLLGGLALAAGAASYVVTGRRR